MAAQPGTAESLYIDPTSVYKPTLELINKQKAQANQRYATNAADIKNIFGNLSTVGTEDAARIKEQFVNTIAEQQAGLATRTAEARANQAAGEAQQAVIGAQRGNGPAMKNDPTAVAREKGIAQSNAYQTIWEALQNANQLQAQTDLTTRTAGYGQQQVDAVSRLKMNLEDVLGQLSGRETETQSQLAQAKLGGQQNVASAKYQETQTSKAEGRQDARDEAARLAAEEANPTIVTFKKNMIADGRGGQYAGLVKFAQDAYNAAYNEVNKLTQDEIDQGLTEKPKPVSPTPAQIKQAWSAISRISNQDPSVDAEFKKRYYGTALIPYMHQYIDLAYGG